MPDAKYSVETEFTAMDLVSKIVKNMSRSTADFEKKTSKAFKVADTKSNSYKKRLSSGLTKISTKFRDAIYNANIFGDTTSKVFKKASSSASLFRSVFKGILAAGAVRAGIRNLTRSVRSSITDFIEYDKHILLAANKFREIEMTTASGIKMFIKYRKEVRQLGADSEFGAVGTAKAWGIMGESGMKARASIVGLTDTMRLARAVGIKELGQAADVATGALVAFGLNVKDQDQVVKNYAKTTDIVALALSRTKISQQELTTAIERGALTWTQAGGSIEQFFALIMAMGRAGIPAEEMGTSIRNLALKITNAGKVGRFWMGKLDIAITDSKKNLLPMIDILGDVEKGFKGLGTAQKLQALQSLFGRRTVNAASAAITEGKIGLLDFVKQIKNATKQSQAMSEVMATSLSVRLEQIKNAAIELAFKFFDAFEKNGKGGLDSFLDAVRAFDMKPIASAVDISFRAFKGLYNVLIDNRRALESLVIGFAAFKGATAAISLVTLIAEGALLVKVMTALNLVMWANPWTWVAAGIGLVAADAYFNWDRILGRIEKGKKLLAGYQKMTPLLTGEWFEKLRADRLKVTGVGGVGGETQEIISPNQTAVDLIKNQINFRGRMDIFGAPEGSKFESTISGDNDIEVNMLGVNP